MSTFTIKKGDTSPSIVATLTDVDGTAINITDATVQFHMRNMSNNELIVDAAATITNATSGIVTYDWLTADTASAGVFSGEFEVTYSDASIETFPNDEDIIVSIEGELN